MSEHPYRARGGANDAAEHLLEVDGLSTTFFTDEGPVPAVQNVSFHLDRGETLGIVGESGSGKTVTSKSIMRLIPEPPGKIVSGQIRFAGEDLVKATPKRLRELRGDHLAMIFQEPMTALNPVFTIGWQIEEALALHQNLTRSQRRSKAIDMLTKVGIPSPAQRIDEYPHQMSGGMRQRVMIAIALCCNPEILIADEPTTALDVTIQAQVLRLIARLKEELGTAVILITHDLGVVAEVCDRVIVMYAAQVVEEAPIDELFHRPAHPYTKALLRSIPKKGVKHTGAFPTIPGMVPDLKRMPAGCRFRQRCEFAQDRCGHEMPQLAQVSKGHSARCFFPLVEEA